ncbi:MAG: DUF1844 domain-containing protein [Pirellulales bacterium]
MADQPGEKPKIIIDEDWKSQVQREKEELERKQEPQQQPGPAAAGEIPPASLPVLLTTLATQAMVALGQIAHPLTGKAEIDLAEARHFIDTLEMLEQKTAGNRTQQESLLLESLLHELRLAYIAVQKRAAASGQSGERPPAE